MRSAGTAETRVDPEAPLNRSQLQGVGRVHAAIFGFYAVDGLFLTALGALGSLSPTFGLVYAALGWCAAALCVGRFRAGRRNRRALDTNNAVMSACAAAQMLSAAWLAPPVGDLMLMSLTTVLAASALQLPKRALACLWLGIAGGSTVLLSAGGTLGLPLATPAHRLVSTVWFAWLLGKCALINVESTRLRVQAAEANRRLEQALGDLAKIATTDELTVIANRRSIVSDLDQALQGDPGPSASIAVALFDIDHFKQVNDRHGHAAGDAVLREFASLVSRGLRPDDRVGRYGGEEFLVVLKQVKTSAAAAETADRMRRSIESFDWSRVTTELRLTASAGVALVGLHESAASAIARADEALYAAKAGGRNRVAVAP